MSIIGWKLRVSAIEKKFTVKTKEKFSMEVRFDPKTGEKLPKKVKVITQEAGDFVTYKGKTYAYTVDLIEAMISSKISSFYDYDLIYLGVDLEDGISFEAITKIKHKLEAAREELIQLGLLPKNNKEPAKLYSFTF